MKKTVATPYVFNDRARFTLYSSGSIRMEYSQDGVFAKGPSLLVGTREARTKKTDISINGKVLQIKTDRFVLTYKDTGELFSGKNLSIDHLNNDAKEVRWFPGKKDAGNLGTVRRCLDQWQWCGGPDHHPVEGVLSLDGGHLIEDKPRVYWNPEYDWPEDLSKRVQFDGTFFAYGHDFKQALKDFVHVYGRIPMIPRWAFGLWYSRWYAYHQDDVVKLAKRYQREKIPLDVMVIDTDWRDNWGGYDWSKKYFPNPKKACKELKDLGCHVGLNDHPGYWDYEDLPPTDSHISAIKERLGPLPYRGRWACDWSRREHVDAWKDILLGPVHDEGVDVWWIDGWIQSPFGESDSQLWANRHYFDLREEKTGERGLILSRWGGIGSHRYPVQFSGDTASEWRVLKHQIEYTARSGNLGAVYWSHDIGGFFGKKVDEELFIRWVQFGAFSPIFRTHSDHGDREPWKFSAKAKAIFRKYARMRCALVPHFYTLARQAHDDGLPLIRPLYLDHSQCDGGAFYRKHQYKIGENILVVPADEAIDKRTGIFTKRAYFPVGRWYSLHSDEIMEGMLDRWLDIPVEEMPIYIKEGAILPSAPVGLSIGSEPINEIAFDIYAAEGVSSTYNLYDDDGSTNAYLKRDGYSFVRIDAKRKGDQLTASIGAPTGKYKGMPSVRTYKIRFRLDPDESVSDAEVKIGKSAWTTAPVKISKTMLSGEVASAWPFAEVEVKTSGKSVQVRMQLNREALQG